MLASGDPTSRLNKTFYGVAVEPVLSNLKHLVDIGLGETFLATRCNDAVNPDLVSNLCVELELYCEFCAGEKNWIDDINSVRSRDAVSMPLSDTIVTLIQFIWHLKLVIVFLDIK